MDLDRILGSQILDPRDPIQIIPPKNDRTLLRTVVRGLL